MVHPRDMAIRQLELREDSSEGISFLHLSDLHFSASILHGRPKFLGLVENELLRQASASDLRPQLVFVTGDIVEQGEFYPWKHKAILRTALTYLKDFCKEKLNLDPATRLVVIPGNHDYRWKGFLGSEVGRAHFDDLFEPYTGHRVYSDGRLLIACFDSNVVRGSAELAMGSVDMIQLAVLHRDLEQLPRDQRPLNQIALVHHHPLPVPAAERLSPENLAERTINRVLGGAPELMVMRNAGTFVQGLLRDGFRLVLHGHLHQPCHWGPIRGFDGEDHWLEIISGASYGAPPDGFFAFGLGRLNRDGTLDYRHGGINIEGRARGPEAVSTAGYDTIRTGNWRRRDKSHAPPVQCGLHRKIWEVILPEGDLVATEMFYGLRSTGEPQPTIPLFRSPQMAVDQFFEVSSLSHHYNVTFEYEALAIGPGAPSVDYRLRFDPPLGKELADVVCKRRSFGGMFSSSESQRLWGQDPAKHGRDRVSQTVWFPSERLVMSLQFNSESYVPNDLAVHVDDEYGRELTHERDCGHVAWDYWNPRRLTAAHPISDPPLPSATLSVIQPQLSHRYKFEWSVPREEPITQRGHLNAVRRALLDLPKHPAQRAQAISLLEEFLTKLRARRPTFARSDSSLHACLFALDEEPSFHSEHGGARKPSGRPAVLKCVATTSDVCPLATAHIAWGRDVIGRAMRIGTPLFFDKSRFDDRSVRLTQNLPPQVASLLAIPLYGVAMDRYPSAVVAIASNSEDGGLRETVEDEAASEELGGALLTLWMAQVNGILGLGADAGPANA